MTNKHDNLDMMFAAIISICIGLGVGTVISKGDSNMSKWSTPQEYRYHGEYIQFRTNLTTGEVMGRVIP